MESRNEKGQFKIGSRDSEFEKKRLEALRKKGPWNKGLRGAQVAWNKGIPADKERSKSHSDFMKKRFQENPELKEIARQNRILQLSKMTSEEIKEIEDRRIKSIKARGPWNRGLKTGQVPWNKGKPMTQELREKIGNIVSTHYRTHPESVQRLKDNRAKQIFPLKDSTIELVIQNFLKQLAFEFSTHNYIHIEHAYQCDIYVPAWNMIIEADGDFWHCNPAIYPRPSERQLRKIEEDNFRTKELKAAGFKVLRLWESEIREMDLQGFIDRVLSVLKEAEEIKN